MGKNVAIPSGLVRIIKKINEGRKKAEGLVGNDEPPASHDGFQVAKWLLIHEIFSELGRRTITSLDQP
ncbi:MAG: hypothetical protein ACPHL6_03410, partial [Rubripirellula sp.]